MSEELINKIEKEVKEFFSKLGFDFEILISKIDNTFKVNIQTKEFQDLIGERGKT